MSDSLKNSKNIKVAVVAVIAVLVVSLITNYFAKKYNVQYTKWFTDVVNRLVDTAEFSASRGLQDTDRIYALQDYTNALAIIDTLSKIVPDVNELSQMTNMNIQNFTKLAEEHRTAVVLSLGQDCKKIGQ